ncbi:uncharacterized protein [Aristolochia californica]|uniref:uncharacterized protein n=1 Tax=Aristolochia californica TaxID=171875 RepID=UPI0035D8CFC1
MARGTRNLVSSCQHNLAPCSLASCDKKSIDKVMDQKKASKLLDKNDWEDAVCPVCIESPHNSVLLLCSSHDNGCRPYMCGTSYHFSNCLDQFKKAHAKLLPCNGQGQVHGDLHHELLENSTYAAAADWLSKYEASELTCPLCRGQVKGWIVVEAARECLNAKKRSCVQDDCSFIGTYQELQKHVRVDHPSAQPRKVDLLLEKKWRMLEQDREIEDVISTIRSSMPGAVIVGDFVIDIGPMMGILQAIRTGVTWCIKMTGIGLVCYYSCKCLGCLGRRAEA